MDISKKINGERWGLTQDESNLITIRKGKDVMYNFTLKHGLSMSKAFALLSKISEGGYRLK